MRSKPRIEFPIVRGVSMHSPASSPTPVPMPAGPPSPALARLRGSFLVQRLMPHTLGRILVRAIARAIDHDCINIAQSTAYSAMVALFPALIVAAAAVSLLPYSAPLRSQMSLFFDRILPVDVSPILQSYFVTTPGSAHSARALLIAGFVSLSGASGVITTFMEGFRRTQNLPEDCWNFWQRRIRALILVPLSLIPLVITSIFVVFGHLFTAWLALHVFGPLRIVVFILAFLLRWTIALTGSVGLIALLYHMGTPKRQSWPSVIPGAIMATALWFVTTLAFGWYVTRFANYSQVYGSLGAGIALLFWLYLICLSVLCGA
ncbi:MAG: YihY/virulence factor BrkB family protein, partial [Granulicella sp.]